MFKFAKAKPLVQQYVANVEDVLTALCKYIGDEELTDDERKDLLEKATYLSENRLPVLRRRLNLMFGE